MPTWDATSKYKLLLAIITVLDAKPPKWDEVVKLMGAEYTPEAVRQQYQKIKKQAGAELAGAGASSAGAGAGAVATTPRSLRKRTANGNGNGKRRGGGAASEEGDEGQDDEEETPSKRARVERESDGDGADAGEDLAVKPEGEGKDEYGILAL